MPTDPDDLFDSNVSNTIDNDFLNKIDLDGILGIGRERGRIPLKHNTSIPINHDDLANVASNLANSIGKYHSKLYVLPVKSDGKVYKVSTNGMFYAGRTPCDGKDIPTNALVSMIRKMQPDMDSINKAMKSLADTYPEMVTEATFSNIKQGIARFVFYMDWHCIKLNTIFLESPAAYLINNELSVGLDITYRRPKIEFDADFEYDSNKRHAGNSLSFGINSYTNKGKSTVDCRRFGPGVFDDLNDIYYWVDVLLDMPAIYNDFRQKLAKYDN